MIDQEISDKALQFVKENQKLLVEQIAGISKFPSVPRPVSIFMAGSPGAGKTEFSRDLIDILKHSGLINVIRIDPDEYRKMFPEYTGSNSYCFQSATSILVEKIHDHALHYSQNFILDATMSDFERGKNNIERSLNKDRKVHVFYVYQRPELAWSVAQKREEKEGRKVTKEVFIERFCGARDSIYKIRKYFGDEVVMFIVKKDIDQSVELIEKILPGEQDEIDKLLGNPYTVHTLNDIL